MLLTRDELIATLFRETDRAQRVMTPLALVLCEISLPVNSGEDAFREVARRIWRLLRCYDSVGRVSEQVWGLVLPGCNSFNAVSLAQRLNIDVFGSRIAIGGTDIPLTACFGVAGSGGRSSLVVFRNAEQALRRATARGAGSIERCAYDSEPDAMSFLTPVIEDKTSLW